MAIERKSLPDLFKCLTGDDLKRFRSQLKRLSEFPYRLLLVEASYTSIGLGYLYSDLPGEVAQKRLIGLGLEYKIPIAYAENRKAAKLLTLQTLAEAYKLAEKDRYKQGGN